MKKSFSILVTLLLLQVTIFADTFYVGNAVDNGEGTKANPFNNFSDAINLAQPGDVIMILPGFYTEKIFTMRGGTADKRIIIRGEDEKDRPVISALESELSIDDPFITIENMVFDGQFASSDVVKISSNGDNAIIRNCEIKNGTKDGIDMDQADDVLIENCEIHHMLGGSFSNQVDAHGIVATGEKNLTIRGCNIYYVTGDCFQTDPNRDYPLWDNVLIEDCKLWTGPLPEDAADWDAGEVPGENAIDTKINEDAVGTDYRPNITIRNVEAYGFVPGYINNRAAFNIKEKVDCKMINIRVYNNEIAFRLRGPNGRGGAHITLINCVAYDNEKTFRTEEDLEVLKIYNSTFDKASDDDYFQNSSGGYDPNGLDLRNCLFTGEVPDEGVHPSNMLASSSDFIDLANGDFHLSNNSDAINAGDDITEVTEDFDGNTRYAGSYDIGAYEFDGTTGIFDPVAGDAAEGFYLYANYPNPFNPSTQITFQLPEANTVKLTVYNMLGQEIRNVTNSHLSAGQHSFQWDGRNDAGESVSSGLYLYRLESGRFTQTRKMHLIQ